MQVRIFFYYTICKFFPKKKSNLGLWYVTFVKKNLVHNFGILTQNFGTLAQNLVLRYNFWVLIPKKNQIWAFGTFGRAFCCERSVLSTTITAAPPLIYLSVCLLSVCCLSVVCLSSVCCLSDVVTPVFTIQYARYSLCLPKVLIQIGFYRTEPVSNKFCIFF